MTSARPRETGTKRIEQLELLVDELMKSRPQEARIRSFMREAGLPYTADPIDQIHMVLTALQSEKPSARPATARRPKNARVATPAPRQMPHSADGPSGS